MEGKRTTCHLHVVGYKHTGKYEEFSTQVGQAFQYLKTKSTQIPSRTDTHVALYEPKRGSDHVEGFFYVGYVVEQKPEQLPEGSEYLYVVGTYASAKGKMKNMGDIYDFIGQWVEENGYELIGPEKLLMERYTFPIREDQNPLEEEVEVLLPIK